MTNANTTLITLTLDPITAQWRTRAGNTIAKVSYTTATELANALEARIQSFYGDMNAVVQCIDPKAVDPITDLPLDECDVWGNEIPGGGAVLCFFRTMPGQPIEQYVGRCQ